MKKLLSVSDIINSPVEKYEGERVYLKTGNLNDDGSFDLEKFSYSDKPSRANQNVQLSDIICARMENTRKVLLIDEATQDIIASTGFVVLRPDKSIIHPVYLYHVINSNVFQNKKNKYCKGATQKAINNSGLSKLEIPVPSLEVQQKIVNCLQLAQSVIFKRKKVLDKMEELLRSYFLTIVGPCAEEFEKWNKFKIEELAIKEKGSMRTGPFGSDLKHSEFVKEGIAVLGIDNAVKNKFAWKQKRFITEEKYSKLKRYTVRPKDVIITIMGTTGRSAVVPDDVPPAITSKHLATITLNHELALPEFISYSIHSHPYILSQIRKANKGAIMDGLNLGIIKKLEINLPPIDLQKQFKEFYIKSQIIREQLENSSVQLETYFQSLLHHAFKGELKL